MSQRRQRGDLMACMLDAMRRGNQRLTHHCFGRDSVRTSFLYASAALGLVIAPDGTYRPGVGTYDHLARYIAQGCPSRYRARDAQTDSEKRDSQVANWRPLIPPHQPTYSHRPPRLTV